MAGLKERFDSTKTGRTNGIDETNQIDGTFLDDISSFAVFGSFSSFDANFYRVLRTEEVTIQFCAENQYEIIILTQLTHVIGIILYSTLVFYNKFQVVAYAIFLVSRFKF